MKLPFINLIILLILLFTLSTNAFAKHPINTGAEQWIQVRSKNFFLIGNAKEKDIRKVATKLEQFRKTFRSLFPNARFNQTIETNVVVFKNEKSYKPFLPKRSDGKADTGVAGYFQSGEDVNYITLSTAGDDEDTYGTIFHEYIHFLLNTNFGRSEIPPWFNEGLAEYYQTFKIKDDQDVYLGKLQNNHLALLQRNQLIPLKTFFAINNYSLHKNGNHSRSIFYAQAWVLIHYLIQTKQSVNMSKFLSAVMNNVEQEKAFRGAFNLDYKTMEKALKKYAKQRVFNITVAKFQNKLLFDDDIKVTPLSETEANAYLGDLLYHTHEYEDAEGYLQKALSLDANQSLANTALGLVRMRQRKFEEAKKYLEKAVAGNRKNHYAHYNYAYVLSRESVDEFGQVTGYPSETAEIMRKSLIKAININPNFTESYRLLAFINLVNNEKLDQAVKYLKKAISLQPGNQNYSLTIAQIYLRQEKFDEAEQIASKIAKTAIEPSLRSNAQNILSNVKTFRENAEEIAKYKRESKKNENEFNEKPNVKRKSTLTKEELAKIELENKLLSLNRQLKKLEKDEKRIVGYTQKIQCLRGGIKYTIKTDTGIVALKSIDFQSLDLLSLTEGANNASVGCDEDLSKFKVVFTFRAGRDTKLKTIGNVTKMAYVPEMFKLKTPEELANSKYITIVDDVEQKRRKLDAIKERLYKPKANEMQALGIAEKIECNKNKMFFLVKINGQSLRLHTDSPRKVRLGSYTKDGAGLRFGCGVKLPSLKVVISYRPSEKQSKKSQGELMALEFVPKSFTL